MKQSTVKAPKTIAALIMAVLASVLLAACPAYATGNYSFKRIDNTFGLSSSNVKCVAEDSYGFIWLGTKNGLHRYDGLDMRRLNCFDHKKKQGNNNIAALYEDERKMMWVGTDRGVYLYNPKTDTFSFLDRKDRRNGKYPDNWVQTIDGDGKGNVWVLLPDLGVFHYHGQSVDYYSVTPIKDNLKEKFPSNICVDDNGDVWVTTASAGIYKFDKRARRFVRVVAADGQDMEGVMFTTVVEDTDGSLIFASTNGYLFRYNPVHNTFSKINFSAEGKIYMRCMQCFEDEIWIGTQHGLYILNKYDNTETVLHEDPLNKFSLSDDIIYCLYESRSGDVWIGTSFGGVNYTSRNKFYFKVFGLWSGLTGRVVNGLTQSADNRIWIGTEDRGLFSLNPSTNIISAIGDITAAQKTVLLLTAFNGSVYAGFSRGGLLRVDGSGRVSTVLNIKEKDNSVYSYLKDSRGNEWVSTDRGGISRYNKKEDNFTSFGIEEGLPDDVAYNILEDNNGNLWFGTNKGLVKFNPDTRAVRVFTVKDGLPNNQFNYNSAIKANDGLFYFGSIGGIIAFNPDKEDNQTMQSSLYFTQLRILNEEVTVDTKNSPLKENIMFTRRLTLPYDMATFSLRVVSPSFGVTSGSMYSYKLEPVNSEWISMSGNQISFANLPPGTYNLCVKVDTHGQTITKSLEIVITPPWYSSKWAYLAYIILIVAGVMLWFVLYRNHKEKQLRERQHLFAVNKEKELYQNKVNFFTEVAHEIRTPLTLIDAPLEAIEEIGINNSRVQHYLKVTRQNTKRLLNLTGQLLDFQKIDSNRLTFKYENVDISALVNETIDRFEPAMTLKDKELIRNVADEPVIVSTDREAVIKILSNLLNNALKYARRRVKVALTTDDSNFIIKVTSDGDKISDSEKKLIFKRFYQIDKSNSGENGVGIGLPLSLSLASLLGGSLELADDGSDGNTFVAILPQNKEGIKHNNKLTVDTSDYLLEEETNQAKENTGGYTVLIVEDNDNMREFLAEQANMSFTIETARNGKEALEKLAGSHIDLIVSDVMMPEMDGFSLCKAVKADINLSHIPIVFITAKNDLESKIKGLQLGAEAYIEKPFSVKFFRQLIRSLLDNRRRERESFSKKPFFNMDNMHMTKADEEFMNKVIKIIEDNVGEDNFNVECMADILCMSHSSLLRKIKSVFNMSPVELIRLIKLKKAAELIQEGKHLIGDICYMVGISSPSYFSKLFFKQFGISPKDFEKQCREKQGNG
ncbi:hybrid sensor histidine kinase/response regulator transcription factor [uncultured Prevotella sp.]|uniref:hybrid sensor histidine kinase/response regulator transcription factor n=1 Tax=uncultured Prevotella sp. TaxID=159272 RepID=UPI0026758DAE|nr:hybrid sensor histidine kinase/response regulator transcription factor [uncultured Prevotella sp.]